MKKPTTNSYVEIRTDQEMVDYQVRIGKRCKNIAVGFDSLGVYRNGNELNKLLLAPQDLPVAIVSFKLLGQQGQDIVSQLLGNEATRKIAYDWCSFGVLLRLAGLRIAGDIFDVKVASQLRNAGLKGYDFCLDNIIKSYLKKTLPADRLERLAMETGVLISLEKILTHRLKKANLLNVADIEFACVPAIVEMHLHGMGVDLRKLKSEQRDLRHRVGNAEEELLDLLDQDINVNNSGWLLDALNDCDELRRGRLRLRDTQKKTLKKHAEKFGVIRAVLHYRELKSRNDAVVACVAHIDCQTGRIHPTYNAMGTTTGRFSCKAPAIQALPKSVRASFIAGRERKLVIGDYSQVELRIAAAISQDERMIDAFQRGDDFHSLTASIILGVPVNKVTKSERKAAKAVNFGVLFGMGARGLCDYASSNFGAKMSIAEAERFQNTFFAAYPQLDAWCQDQMDSALCWVEEDEVWETRTLCDRIRLWMDLPRAPELVNSPIQGTAADIIKIALSNVVKKVEGMDVKIIACVHDEIVVETDQEIAEQVCVMLEGCMVEAASALLAPVPVEVDLVVSDSWQ